jgi:mRNA-degrading endonuclease YafQ of YafQ-DinJ toxin-antitoxin module
MHVRYTDYFRKKFKKKLSKNQLLRKKIIKQTKILLKDPTYPSLKLHKLSGKRKNQFSFWIEGNLRITFEIKSSYYLFVDIVSHDEYEH